VKRNHALKKKTPLMCHFALNQNINEEEKKRLLSVSAPDTCSALKEKGIVEEM